MLHRATLLNKSWVSSTSNVGRSSTKVSCMPCNLAKCLHPWDPHPWKVAKSRLYLMANV